MVVRGGGGCGGVGMELWTGWWYRDGVLDGVVVVVELLVEVVLELVMNVGTVQEGLCCGSLASAASLPGNEATEEELAEVVKGLHTDQFAGKIPSRVKPTVAGLDNKSSRLDVPSHWRLDGESSMNVNKPSRFLPPATKQFLLANRRVKRERKRLWACLC